jgi:hypothetical protein
MSQPCPGARSRRPADELADRGGLQTDNGGGNQRRPATVTSFETIVTVRSVVFAGSVRATGNRNGRRFT